jgi:hypothetical protein
VQSSGPGGAGVPLCELSAPDSAEQTATPVVFGLFSETPAALAGTVKGNVNLQDIKNPLITPDKNCI